MAIYHLSVQVISRGGGRSCVAAAAYRAGEKLADERQGLTHDYTRRGDVRETFIMAPPEAPAWVTDRQALWTAVDAAEKRKDARTAREVNVALPRELTSEQQREVVREFVQAAFVERGMVADVAIHEGHNVQEPNPHAHILLTTRTMTADGFGPKNRDWNAKELLVTWRTQWEITCNEALEDAQQTVRIDARSLVAQGVTDRLPTVHEGVAVRQMERRGVQTERGDINRVVKAHRQTVVDLAAVREHRQPLEQVQQRIHQAEAWRGQAGWPEPERQRVRGWEEQAGRVLTRADVTQWVQEAQATQSHAMATYREAGQRLQEAQQALSLLQTTKSQLAAQVKQAQQAQDVLQREFSGVRGVWARWRGNRWYQYQHEAVRQGMQAERQLDQLQGPLAQQQEQVAQRQEAYTQARTAMQTGNTKLASWKVLLNYPWTPEELHAQRQTQVQAQNRARQADRGRSR